MRGFLFFTALSALRFLPAAGEEVIPGEIHDRIDSAIVSVSRAGVGTPVTFTTVGKDALLSSNPLNSLPMSLSLQPSVVVTNEGGTGLGYSKMTVRGSKGSQINVTLNGITLNDAESQEVFWVNIPSLTSILSSVQIQRGLGTSSNGSGAFGASINMNTAFIGPAPTATFDVSRGSWNTTVSTVSASTGLTPSGFYANATWSKGRTDGYIRNAWADVESAFTVLGWLKGSNSLRFTWLMGNQHTGITWDGIPLANYRTDRRTNSAGAYKDADGNTRYYDNASDNYRQHHFQLNYTRRFNPFLTWITTLNYTWGKGYDEYYKADKKFSKYGIDNYFEGVGNPRSDFIIRKYMANGYYVGNSELRYNRGALDIAGGIYLSRYNGDHYGDVLWTSLLGNSVDYSVFGASDPSNPWYFNRGEKKDMSAFVKAEYSPLAWLTAYADLQFRHINLDMNGVDDDDDMPLDYSTSWDFFNPRAGLTARLSASQSLYASVAVGHREPGRGDIKEIIGSNILEGASRELKPERMVDFEAGYRYTGRKFSASANIYMMEYHDMLLETGKLSQSGYAIKENVGKSYRRGVELALAWTPFYALRLDANTTLSTNKILDHTQYYITIDDDWNLVSPQYSEHLGKVTMLMSPSATAKGRITLTPFKSGSLRTAALAIDCRYVGRQYWDNTENADRSIPAYFVSDLSLGYDIKVGGGVLGLSAYVSNLFNHKYFADAWGALYYSSVTGEKSSEEGVYPQATTGTMFRLTYRF